MNFGWSPEHVFSGAPMPLSLQPEASRVMLRFSHFPSPDRVAFAQPANALFGTKVSAAIADNPLLKMANKNFGASFVIGLGMARTPHRLLSIETDESGFSNFLKSDCLNN